MNDESQESGLLPFVEAFLDSIGDIQVAQLPQVSAERLHLLRAQAEHVRDSVDGSPRQPMAIPVGNLPQCPVCGGRPAVVPATPFSSGFYGAQVWCDGEGDRVPCGLEVHTHIEYSTEQDAENAACELWTAVVSPLRRVAKCIG